MYLDNIWKNKKKIKKKFTRLLERNSIEETQSNESDTYATGPFQK